MVIIIAPGLLVLGLNEWIEAMNALRTLPGTWWECQLSPSLCPTGFIHKFLLLKELQTIAWAALLSSVICHMMPSFVTILCFLRHAPYFTCLGKFMHYPFFFFLQWLLFHSWSSQPMCGSPPTDTIPKRNYNYFFLDSMSSLPPFTWALNLSS